MKIRVLITSALLAVFLLLSVSCKSTPEAGTDVESGVPATGTPADIPVVSNETIHRVDQARQRAIDFGAPEYFPSEWEAAEAQYAIAKTNPGEAQQAVNEAAATYNDLFRRAVSLFAQAREDEIISARNELINTGLTHLIPEQLKAADDLALTALAQYEAGEYYEARDSAALALNEYQTLLFGAKVYLTRQEIADRGFSRYDADGFSRADEVGLSALDEFNAGNIELALSYAEEAMVRYNIILANGWAFFAGERRTSTISERDRAVTERVNIASRESFREADTVFNQAEESFKSGNFPDAASLFLDAKAYFTIAIDETREKRHRAEEAIRMAEQKIEESSGTAAEAERIIEGGIR